MTLDFRINGQHLSLLGNPFVVAESYDFLEASFTFTDDWADTTERKAYFKLDTDTYEVPITDDAIAKTAHINLAEGAWLIYVVGYDSDGDELIQRIPTNTIELVVRHVEGFTGGLFPEEYRIAALVQLDQTVEQTLTGGVPKLSATRVISNANHLADKKFVEDAVATVTADDFAHNSLSSLQGGGATERYHMTQAENAALHAHSNKTALDLVSGTNTGDQDVSGAISAHNTDAGAHADKQTKAITDAGSYFTTDTVEAALQESGSKLVDIDNRFSAGIASPAGTYANLAALIAANPDRSKTYITLDDGKWCYYNGSAFVAGGLYTATAASGMTIVDAANHFAATQVEGALNEVGQVDNAVVANITIPNPVIQAYYGIEGNSAIASTFRGWAHQINYTSGIISVVMILCRTDIAGEPIKCTIRKLNMSTILATGYSVSTGTSAWRTFVLDVTLDATLITESGFFVAVEAVYGAGCRLRADYGAGLVVMNHNAAYHDYYTTTSSASWEDSGASNYPMCVRLGNFETISLVRDVVELDGYNVLALPKKVYGVANKELNIYFDSLSRYDYKKKTFEIASTYGTQQNERWTYNGALATGSIAVNMYSRMLQYLSTASATLTMASASAKTGQNPTCLFIGDSLTAAGTITGELLTLMAADVMDITLIGTIGTSPNLHEGISGYAINDFYAGASSPFVYSGAFDFSQYMTAHSFAAVDYVFICLGINDIFGTGFTPDAVDAKWIVMKAQLEAMITNIKLFNASVKIGLMTSPPPAYEQDGFGKNYYCGVSQWTHHRAWHQMVCHMLADFDAREAEAIYIVPTHVNLDTEHNMQTETIAVNSRNSATIARQSNGIHPAAYGYYQMADSVYYFIKNV